MDPSEVTILVVEDDEFTRMATIDILKSCKYTVFAVENGKEALNVLLENQGKFDMVLCDVMLPVMTGIELLDEIEKKNNLLGHIPVVMTSSNEEMDVVTSCLSKGAKDYLIKPIQVNTAKTLVRHVWLSRQQEKTNTPKSLWKDIEVIRTIGKGTHGTVVLARRKMDGAIVAVKRIRTSQISESGRKQANNEVILLKSLYHVNIVRFYDHFMVEDELNIVMEYSDGGNLRQLVKMRQREKMGSFPENVIMCWFAQLVLAVAYIHGKNVLHRDLKAQNVFLTRKNVVKLGDFGISKALSGDDTANTACGTPESMSPEICRGEPYGKKSDIWSLGCILYEMIMLRRPFEASSLPDIFTKICQGEYPQIPSIFSRELRLLVQLMLQQDANKRPAIEDICRFPFVQAPIQAFLSEHVAEFQEALELEAKLHQPSLYSTTNGTCVSAVSPTLRRSRVTPPPPPLPTTTTTTTEKKSNSSALLLSDRKSEDLDLIRLSHSKNKTPEKNESHPRGEGRNSLSGTGTTSVGELLHDSNEVGNKIRKSAIAAATVGLVIDTAAAPIGPPLSPLLPLNHAQEKTNTGTGSSSSSSSSRSSSTSSNGGNDLTKIAKVPTVVSDPFSLEDFFVDELRSKMEVSNLRAGFFTTYHSCVTGFDVIRILKKHFHFKIKNEQEAIEIFKNLIQKKQINHLGNENIFLFSSCNNNFSEENLNQPESYFRFQVDEMFLPLNMKYIMMDHHICSMSPMDLCLSIRNHIKEFHQLETFPFNISMGFWNASTYHQHTHFLNTLNSGNNTFHETMDTIEKMFHDPWNQNYRSFLKRVARLQNINIGNLPKHERQAFFINIYNTMVLHGFIEFGIPQNIGQYRAFEKDVKYVIGGFSFTLGDIKHGILRCNRKPPANYWERQLQPQDPKLHFRLHIRDPRSLLVLIDSCKPIPNSKDVPIFKPGRTDTDLEEQVEKFCKNHIQIDNKAHEIRLPRLFRIFRDDFGASESELVAWLSQYMNLNHHTVNSQDTIMTYRVKYMSGISS